MVIRRQLHQLSGKQRPGSRVKRCGSLLTQVGAQSGKIGHPQLCEGKGREVEIQALAQVDHQLAALGGKPGAQQLMARFNAIEGFLQGGYIQRTFKRKAAGRL